MRGSLTARRVLVVDDSEDVRRTVSRILRSLGCIPDVAANGVEGLARLAHSTFDAIISDVRMPSMDGVEFWHAIREQHPHLRNRVLLCSASVPLEQLGDLVDDVHFLAKPFEIVQLETALRTLLEAPAA
jgi:CheY-like chemotaxis protein